MENKDPVNIIIVTWNACGYTKFCVDSIKRYTDIPYHLTVVDNGSTDETLDYLKLQPDIRVIANKENLGYGGAINQGYEVEPTRFVCVMNNDIVVSPSWLKTMTQTLQENPDIGLLGTLRPTSFCLHPGGNRNTGTILEETRGKVLPNPEEWLKRYCYPFDYLDFCDKVKRTNNFGLKTVEGPPSFISTCCVLANSKVIEKVGGLADPRFFKYGSEDVDLCWRISAAGYKVAITSEVYTHHYKHISAEVSNLDRKTLNEENNRIFYQKWQGEINRFLMRKQAEGEDVRKRMVESDSEYWFLARIANIVGPELFWRSVEGANYGKERK